MTNPEARSSLPDPASVARDAEQLRDNMARVAEQTRRILEMHAQNAAEEGAEPSALRRSLPAALRGSASTW